MKGKKKVRQGIAVFAFARKMGVGDTAVRSRIRSGRLAAAVHPDGSLDEELATRLWIENVDLARRRKVLTPPADQKARIAEDAEEAGDAYALKIERMRVALDTERLKLEQLRGTAIDRDEARKAVRAFARAWRDLVLNFPSRNGAAIAAKVRCNSSLLIGILEAELRDMLRAGVKVPPEPEVEQ